MFKNIKLLALLGLSLPCMGFAMVANAEAEPIAANATYRVNFYNNYQRQEFTLSNGFKGKGNNLLFKSVDVQAGATLANLITENPTRRNYDFAGWYTETTCENFVDVSTYVVNSDLRLYAKWDVAQQSEIIEPTYTPPSTVLEDSASTSYVINSVMNFKVNSNNIAVSSVALAKLEASKTNVLPLMEYKVKRSKTITATYESNVITVTCDGETKTINVVDKSVNLKVNNTTYENKAVKYEQKALEEESYHVMLAGSSSIEFWESSKQDLDPIVSYNHGIGGTTIEQWENQLNPRLVYPYKPKMVVYYVGINNVINSGESSSTISNRLVSFFNKTHQDMPDTKVQYIMMNLIPGYTSKFQIINEVNASVREYQASRSSWLTLINPGTALLKENGEPNAAYFRTDGLHLSHYGYVVWGGIIRESIINGLEAMK